MSSSSSPAPPSPSRCAQGFSAGGAASSDCRPSKSMSGLSSLNHGLGKSDLRGNHPVSRPSRSGARAGSVERCETRITTPPSRRHVDGVEADVTIRREGAVKSDLRAGSDKTALVKRASRRNPSIARVTYMHKATKACSTTLAQYASRSRFAPPATEITAARVRTRSRWCCRCRRSRTSAYSCVLSASRVPRCCGGFTPSTRASSPGEQTEGGFFFRFWGGSGTR